MRQCYNGNEKVNGNEIGDNDDSSNDTIDDCARRFLFC